jgi:hypothetical protein
MRTKVLLCAAALAASLASSMAQNVYSLNVVGYVNVTLPANAFSLVANPLDATMGGTNPGMDNLTNLFANATANSTVQTFDPTAAFGAGDWRDPLTFSGGATGWFPNSMNLVPGQGVLFFNNGPALNITFVGQVVQGPYTVATMTSGSFNTLGLPSPVGGDATTNSSLVKVLSACGLAPAGNDTIQKFDPTLAFGAGDWTDPETFYGGTTGWFPGTMLLKPADGFLYFRNGANYTWVSNFTVQ